jgi:hypothetical protein
LFSHIQRWFLTQASRQKAKAKGNALRTELMKKQKVDENVNAETWKPSKKRRKMNTWLDYISHKIDVSKELDAYFNCPKIQLMSHWVEQIRRHRAFQQYSTESHEQAHKTNLKDGWNASNHNLNYLATSNHRSVSHPVLQSQRAQSPSPPSASGEQRCCIPSPSFRC